VAELDIPTTAWVSSAYRHVESDRPADAVDTTASALRGDGRWNSKGEHTLYLAGDQALATAEFARHLEHRPAALIRPLRPRSIFQIQARLFQSSLTPDSECDSNFGREVMWLERAGYRHVERGDDW
jgi:hypothetical protein